MKNLSLVLIAIAFFTTSCVDNVVSPQVEAIRAQQVEWMKAKTSTELALAAMKTAEADYQVQINASSRKMDSLNLLSAQLNYNLLSANNATALKQAEAALATADLNLKTALNNLSVLVARSGDDQAQEYYKQYSDQATILSSLYSSRLEIQNNLTSQNLVLASNTILLDEFKRNTQADIDHLNVTLIAQKAGLASYNSIVADPNSIQTEINTLTKVNYDLAITKDKLNADYVKASNVVTVTAKIYTDGQVIIAKMSSLKSQLKTNAANLVAVETNLSLANTSLATAKSDLANRITIFNQEKLNFDAKVLVYNDAKATKDAAQNDFNIKISATNIARNNWDGVTADANKTKYENAKVISDAANIVLTSAANSLNIATTAMNNAFSSYNAAKLTVVNFETIVSNAENNVLTVNSNRSTLLLEKTTLDKAIADLAASFTIESAKQFQYAQDVTTASDAVNAINKNITAITTTMYQNLDVITKLTTGKNNIEVLKAAIETQKDAIAITEKTIAQKTQDLTLSTASAAKALVEGKIAQLIKDLDAVSAKIAAAEKLAAYWKGLLDKIFTV